MKKTIWKFEIEITDKQEILLPKGAQVLTIQPQNGKPMMWALVDPNKEKEPRTIEIYGTGHSIEENDSRSYISTFQVSGGVLVFHAFIISK